MARASLIVFAAMMAVATPVLAQGNAGFVNGYPTRELAQRTQDDADFQRAVVAYRFADIRIYGPEGAAFNSTRTPGDFELVQ